MQQVPADEGAAEVEEGVVERVVAFVAHEQAAVGVQPGEVALNDPATGPVRRFSSAEGCGINGAVLSWGVYALAPW